MIKRYSLVGLTLFILFLASGAASKARTEPQATTIRVIANSQTIPDGQNIPITVGQSIQLTVQLVNPDNSTTDITSAAETVYCSMTPWNLATSASTKGLETATVDTSFGVTLGQFNTGVLIVQYLAGDVSVAPRTVQFAIGSGSVSAPTTLVATTYSTTQVNLTWAASTGSLEKYQVERSTSITGTFTLLGSPTTNSFSDTAAAAGHAYIYRVRAIDTSDNPSLYSNMDLATVWNYLDEPIVAGATPFNAAHINDLRNATNAARAAVGLPAYTWQLTVASGFDVKAQPVTELRTAVNAALAVLSISAPSYTDPGLTVGTPIRAAHINELRTALK